MKPNMTAEATASAEVLEPLAPDAQAGAAFARNCSPTDIEERCDDEHGGGSDREYRVYWQRYVALTLFSCVSFVVDAGVVGSVE